MTTTPTIEYIKKLIDDGLRMPSGDKPRIGFMGFGTWAKLAESLQEPLGPDSKSVIFVGHTGLVADPYCEEGVIVFCNAEKSSVVTHLVTGLEFLNI